MGVSLLVCKNNNRSFSSLSAFPLLSSSLCEALPCLRLPGPQTRITARHTPTCTGHNIIIQRFEACNHSRGMQLASQEPESNNRTRENAWFARSLSRAIRNCTNSSRVRRVQSSSVCRKQCSEDSSERRGKSKQVTQTRLALITTCSRKSIGHVSSVLHQVRPSQQLQMRDDSPWPTSFFRSRCVEVLCGRAQWYWLHRNSLPSVGRRRKG